MMPHRKAYFINTIYSPLEETKVQFASYTRILFIEVRVRVNLILFLFLIRFLIDNFLVYILCRMARYKSQKFQNFSCSL